MKQNIYKIISIILLLIVVFLVLQKGKVSEVEIYKFDSECSKDAWSYSKNKSDSYINWEVTRSRYSNGACYSEFTVTNPAADPQGSVNEIFDLTHNRSIGSFHFHLNKDDDVATYTRLGKEYTDLRTSIFGE